MSGMRILFLSAALFLSPLIAHGGGTLSRDEFLSEISDLTLRAFIAQNFLIEEEGRAMRIGRQEPNAGERVTPFEIIARPARSDEGNPAPIVLRLDQPDTTQLALVPCSKSEHYDEFCR